MAACLQSNCSSWWANDRLLLLLWLLHVPPLLFCLYFIWVFVTALFLPHFPNSITEKATEWVSGFYLWFLLFDMRKKLLDTNHFDSIHPGRGGGVCDGSPFDSSSTEQLFMGIQVSKMWMCDNAIWPWTRYVSLVEPVWRSSGWFWPLKYALGWCVSNEMNYICGGFHSCGVPCPHSAGVVAVLNTVLCAAENRMRSCVFFRGVHACLPFIWLISVPPIYVYDIISRLYFSHRKSTGNVSIRLNIHNVVHMVRYTHTHVIGDRTLAGVK